MSADQKGWKNSKKQALEKLDCAIKAGDADSKALPLIKKINSHDEYYTTSSCAGRISLIEVKNFGSKESSRFVGVWHGKVKQKDFDGSLEYIGTEQVWLKAEPPILHVKCKDLDGAKRLLDAAYNNGWKYSSIKSIREGVLVELGSSERMELPVATCGKIIAGAEYLRRVVKLANEKLAKSQGKLKRLEKAI